MAKSGASFEAILDARAERTLETLRADNAALKAALVRGEVKRLAAEVDRVHNLNLKMRKTINKLATIAKGCVSALRILANPDEYIMDFDPRLFAENFLKALKRRNN